MFRIAEEKGKKLLPIMSPLFNLREICKQMSLLEDHLNNPRKRCSDCIRKHFLTIEALFEEAVSLDRELKYDELLTGKAQLIRELQAKWIDCRETSHSHSRHLSIAQELRSVRKEFAPLCFDIRKMASSVCTHRRKKIIARVVEATLSRSEREDREVVKRMTRTSPKKKPPRSDLMRKRLVEEDTDLQGLNKGPKGDPDLRTEQKK